MTPKLFSELGLSPESLKAIDKLGWEQAAPIQAEAIPMLMEGKDVVGQSMTGSGKTAAFAIPVIEKTDAHKRVVQALILCPTRELAVQVAGEVHKLALFKRGIHALPIYGGQSYDRQYQGLRAGAQIVIGTPGRVMDHMRRGTLRLETVQFVVLDEADVMLDMGFREDIEFILKAVPPERQTVFFSATMPAPIRDLIKRFSRDPQTIQIQQKTLTVPTVEQVYYDVDRRFKMELLMRLIDLHDYKLGLIFCNTKRMVDELVDHLEAQGYSADRLHGDLSQQMRDRVMNKFRRGDVEFLVATDVAARGIDVDDVQVVINFDLPYDVEDYVHRIGRTGRAGKSGRAISFAGGRDVFMIRHIERFTRTRILRERPPSEGEVTEARTSAFVDKLRALLRGGEFRKQDRLVDQLLEEGFSSTDISSALLHMLQGGEPQSAPRGTRDAPGVPVAKPRPVPAKPLPIAPGQVAATSAPAAPPAHAQPAAQIQPVEAGPTSQHSPATEPVETGPANPATVSTPADAGPGAPPHHAAPPPARPAPQPPSRTYGAQREWPGRPRHTFDRPAPYQQTGGFQGGRDDWRRASHSPPPFEDRGDPGQAPRRPWERYRDQRPPFRSQGDYAERPGGPAAPVGGPKVRLNLNVGAAVGVRPGDVVGAILGETGLPSHVVGAVEIHPDHTFVDVEMDHARAILSRLNRTRIRGHAIRAKSF